MNNVSDLLIE